MICLRIKLETEWFDFFSRMLFEIVLCKEYHAIADELIKKNVLVNLVNLVNLVDSLDHIYDKMPKLLEQHE